VALPWPDDRWGGAARGRAGVRPRVSGLQSALLFGSHARREASQASDVDVAFLASAAITPSLLRAVRQELELAIGSGVYLVDLRVADTVLRHEITQQGEVLHDLSGVEVEGFLDFALRDYVRLNEERSGILQTAGSGDASMILPKDRDPRFITIRRGGRLIGSRHRVLAAWAAA
jgi:predicted nucleotidyltransferase